MKQKLIVMSIDSMVTEDLEILAALPNYAKVLKGASIVKRNLTTYPTLTHSIHGSIITGCNAGTHGAINNEYFCPGEASPNWFDKASDLKVPTLPQVAKKEGYTTAYVYYPLTWGADAEWVIHRPGVGGPHAEYANADEEMKATSTPGLCELLDERCHSAWELPHYYDWDEYAARACEQLILRFQPDIIYTHITAIDAERHHHGVFNPVLKETYEFLDRGMGYILDALEKTGLTEETIFVITADHGHQDINRLCSPNVLLAQEGLIQVHEDGSLKDWEAFVHGSGLTAQIYTKDHTPEQIARIRKLLEDNKESLGFSKILTRDEVNRRYGLNGEFDLVGETDDHTGFTSAWTGPLMQESGQKDYRGSKATHGHFPEKGVQPLFILKDPKNLHPVTLEMGRVIDQAPTLAALLGFDMPTAEGTVIPALLR